MNCMKCKTAMFQAKLSGDQFGVGVYLTNRRKGMFETMKSSDVTCFVCPDCGNIELKANSPEKLQLD